MVDNINTSDFSGAAVKVRTTEAGGIHTPHHRDPETITLLNTVVALLTTQAGFLDSLETILQSPAPVGENHIGSVSGSTSYVDVTLTTDTAIYASGDVLADTQPITNAMRINNATGILQSVQVLDEDDQGAGFDLVFMSANNPLGTENAAPSITDVLARDILGYVSVFSGDYIDIGGCRIATRSGIGLVVKPLTGTRDVYVAAITRGTPTYSATGLKLRLGFLLD